MNHPTLASLVSQAAIYRKAANIFSKDSKMARDIPSKRAECLRLAYEYATLTKATTEFLVQVLETMPEEERQHYDDLIKQAAGNLTSK